MTTITFTNCCACLGHEKKINKILSKTKGIQSWEIDWANGLILITGNVDREKLVHALKKKLGEKNVGVQGPQVAAPAVDVQRQRPQVATHAATAATATATAQPGSRPQPRPAGGNGGSAGPVQQPGLLPPGIGRFQPQQVPAHGSYGGPRPEQVYAQGYGGYGYQNGPYGAPIPQGYGPQFGPSSSAWQGQQGPQVGPSNSWQGQQPQYGYGNMQQNYHSPLSEEDPNACSVM